MASIVGFIGAHFRMMTQVRARFIEAGKRVREIAWRGAAIYHREKDDGFPTGDDSRLLESLSWVERLVLRRKCA
jgi:hypothetical protein